MPPDSSLQDFSDDDLLLMAQAQAIREKELSESTESLVIEESPGLLDRIGSAASSVADVAQIPLQAAGILPEDPMARARGIMKIGEVATSGGPLEGALETVAELGGGVAGAGKGAALGATTSPITGPVGPIVGAAIGGAAGSAGVREILQRLGFQDEQTAKEKVDQFAFETTLGVGFGVVGKTLGSTLGSASKRFRDAADQLDAFLDPDVNLAKALTSSAKEFDPVFRKGGVGSTGGTLDESFDDIRKFLKTVPKGKRREAFAGINKSIQTNLNKLGKASDDLFDVVEKEIGGRQISYADIGLDDILNDAIEEVSSTPDAVKAITQEVTKFRDSVAKKALGPSFNRYKQAQRLLSRGTGKAEKLTEAREIVTEGDNLISDFSFGVKDLKKIRQGFDSLARLDKRGLGNSADSLKADARFSIANQFRNRIAQTFDEAGSEAAEQLSNVNRRFGLMKRLESLAGPRVAEEKLGKTVVGQSNRIGDRGFILKGLSPIVDDVPAATLLERGQLSPADLLSEVPVARTLRGVERGVSAGAGALSAAGEAIQSPAGIASIQSLGSDVAEAAALPLGTEDLASFDQVTGVIKDPVEQDIYRGRIESQERLGQIDSVEAAKREMALNVEGKVIAPPPKPSQTKTKAPATPNVEQVEVGGVDGTIRNDFSFNE